MDQQTSGSKVSSLVEKNEALILQNGTKTKDGSCTPHGKMQDDMLYYMNECVSVGDKEALVAHCLGHYSSKQINAAKHRLIENYEEQVNKLDPKMMDDLKLNRRNSDNRPANEAIINDIYNILTMFDGHDKRLEIRPTDGKEITISNPIAMSEKAILTRFLDLENRLIKIETENVELKAISSADKEKIKKLESDIIDLQNANKDLLTSIQHIQ